MQRWDAVMWAETLAQFEDTGEHGTRGVQLRSLGDGVSAPLGKQGAAALVRGDRSQKPQDDRGEKPQDGEKRLGPLPLRSEQRGSAARPRAMPRL